jgi:hypothetical protein
MVLWSDESPVPDVPITDEGEGKWVVYRVSIGIYPINPGESILDGLRNPVSKSGSTKSICRDGKPRERELDILMKEGSISGPKGVTSYLHAPRTFELFLDNILSRFVTHEESSVGIPRIGGTLVGFVPGGNIQINVYVLNRTLEGDNLFTSVRLDSILNIIASGIPRT